MSHNHAHDHSSVPASYNRAFVIGIVLNLIFVAIELLYGSLVDSLALIADAGHNFSDVLSLLLAFGATLLAGRQPTVNHTYGLRRATILASVFSALLLLLALGGIVWEAVSRLSSPEPVDGITVMVVAGIGVVINTATALLFISGQKHDLNIRGAFLHMAADAAVSLGVVIAGLLIMTVGWLWIDPVISLIIVLVVFFSSWSLLRDSLDLSLDAVPRNVDIEAVRAFLASLPEVTDLHDLHVWGLSTTEAALTVHLVTDAEPSNPDFLTNLSHQLQTRFDIDHATVQIERSMSAEVCLLNHDACG